MPSVQVFQVLPTNGETHIKEGDPNFEWILITLDGVLVEIGIEADTIEGWVDCRIYKQPVQFLEKYTEEPTVVRRYGNVEFVGYIEH